MPFVAKNGKSMDFARVTRETVIAGEGKAPFTRLQKEVLEWVEEA